jgi:hypothetical protein
MLSKTIFLAILSGLLACSSNIAQSQAESANLEEPSRTPDAKLVFMRLRDYLKKGPLDFETSFDARSQGTELYRGLVHFIVSQPNLLRIEASSGDRSFILISDGKLLTIYNPGLHKYAQVDAPSSPAAAFSILTGELGVESQILDFFVAADDVVSETSEIKVDATGPSNIGGRQCDGFTLSGKMGDNQWEAWLEKKNVPLMCKLIYHSVDGPVQTNEFTWNPTPLLTPDTFVFSAPAGSKKVDMGTLGLSLPD